MRILVTGCAGFIGYHACRVLSDAGHRILGVDNLNNYYLPALKQARIRDLGGKIEFRKLDLADLADLEGVFKEFQPEKVLHLAAQAGVRYSLENPHAYIHSNVSGTMNILECCRHFGKPRLVYASSSSVYGGNEKQPFSEEDRVDSPLSVYAATKRSNELTAHAYTHLYEMQTIGLRFFTVYGPWGRPDMALWLFTDAILAGKPIDVFNRGDMARDFTYIDDIQAGIKGALFSEGLAGFELFNLGNNRSEALTYLIGLIERSLGRESSRTLMPMQDGDVKETFADIAKARAKLGYQPMTTIQEGVPRFVEWFLDHPEFHGANL